MLPEYRVLYPIMIPRPISIESFISSQADGFLMEVRTLSHDKEVIRKVTNEAWLLRALDLIDEQEKP